MTENKTTTASEEAAPLPANAGLPLVTIGLPVYNGGEFLDEAVESLLAQDYSNFELLISDNGSTDTTRAICEEWAARDARVRLVRQPKNRGAMWNFHFVMRHALSEYFVWAAHDDLWEPDFLSSCMAVLLADPRAVLCHCVIQPIASDGARTGEEVWWKPLGQPQRRARWKQAVREPMVHAAIYGVMRRRHAIRAVKYLEAWGSDWVFVALMALDGKVLQVPRGLSYKRAASVPTVFETHARAWEFARFSGQRPPVLVHASMYAVMRRALRDWNLPRAQKKHLTRDTWRAYARYFFVLDLKETLIIRLGERRYEQWRRWRAR